MMSHSLFNMMEFSQQPENYLDEMFGLSADILAGDLDSEGSILDLGYEGVAKLQQSGQESLEDLLLQAPVRDSFGEDWMETVDFKTLLDSNTANLPTRTAPQSVPAIKMEPTEPARKEGMKVAAFELLKALLTGHQVVKSKQQHLTVPITTPPVTSPAVEVPNIDFPVLSSPVADQPALDFSSNFADFDILLGDNFKQEEDSFENLIELRPDISLQNTEVVEIEPLDGPLIASIELLDTVSQSQTDISVTRFTNFSCASPQSSDEDSMSFLSSGCSSPSSYTTIDSNQFSDSGGAHNSVKSSQVSEQDFTKLKTKSKKDKSRSSPYDPDYEVITNKKMRKKVQNKNAATRYRVKKRVEKETLQEQELRLSDNNKELREKVESLAREIKYMKELMSEINKAKQRKI